MSVKYSNKLFQFRDNMLASVLKIVKLPFHIRDVYSNNEKMELRVHIIKTNIPLLIGRDTHLEYNMMTIPAQLKSKFGGKNLGGGIQLVRHC